MSKLILSYFPALEAVRKLFPERNNKKMKTSWVAWGLLLSGGVLMLLSCQDDNAGPQSDTVIIGDQEWMVKNLDVDTFRNGDLIMQAITDEEWIRAGQEETPAWCYYKNDPANGEFFGRLYNGYAVYDPRGLAPPGWHVPTKVDWNRLVAELGGFSSAGTKMKSQSHWASSNTDKGTNSSGFTALPGSFRLEYGLFPEGKDFGLGYYATFWPCEALIYYSSAFGGPDFCEMDRGLSVRCLKGEDDFSSLIIGDQEWMLYNLNLDTFRNGDPIPHAESNADWSKAASEGTPAWCYYKNDPVYGDQYGKLYNWYAVNDPRHLTPVGWHVPTDADWNLISDAWGGDQLSGGALKSFKGWNEPNVDATNSTGFTGLPGEFRNGAGDFYESIQIGLFWSSTASDAQNAILRGLTVNSGILLNYTFDKGGGMSVRCIHD